MVISLFTHNPMDKVAHKPNDNPNKLMKNVNLCLANPLSAILR
ncbi:hypothetical protein A33Q_1214 [Indibacter alkaliphilus LW1]|uniref:Uncharacterized protein n=1 Tax=Indibacter alkaliphilus (strain CCUG 57479 / KCTC 22604 / LW1) TaxID=1189612 RepID=S2DN00_INDAL|nr:hypothetical protein A33Q_1214 [Indibacter alkaliphilus LW1]